MVPLAIFTETRSCGVSEVNNGVCRREGEWEKQREKGERGGGIQNPF